MRDLTQFLSTRETIAKHLLQRRATRSATLKLGERITGYVHLARLAIFASLVSTPLSFRAGHQATIAMCGVAPMSPTVLEASSWN